MNRWKIRLISAVVVLAVAAGCLTAPASAKKKNKGSQKEHESQTMNSIYLLPDANTYYISESEISWMTDNELLLARNEFYARRGRKFDTKFIKDYFKAQGWYKGKIKAQNFSPAVFNKYEQANIDYIRAYERMRAILRMQRKQKPKGKRRLIVTGPSSDGIDNYKKVTKVYSELKVPNSGTENTEEAQGEFSVNSLVYGMEDPKNSGYCLLDMNGGGTMLLVGPQDPQDYGVGAVFDIYMLMDGEPVEVASSSEDAVFYMCSDGTFCRERTFEDGSWQEEYYDLVDGGLYCTNVLRMDEKDPNNPWYAAKGIAEITDNPEELDYTSVWTGMGATQDAIQGEDPGTPQAGEKEKDPEDLVTGFEAMEHFEPEKTTVEAKDAETSAPEKEGIEKVTIPDSGEEAAPETVAPEKEEGNSEKVEEVDSDGSSAEKLRKASEKNKKKEGYQYGLIWSSADGQRGIDTTILNSIPLKPVSGAEAAAIRAHYAAESIEYTPIE